MKRVLLCVCLVALFTSCATENEKSSADTKIQRDPKESIYFDIQINHSKGVDLLYVTKIVHNEMGQEVKTIQSVDTIPTMSLTKDTLSTGRTYTNSEGDELSVDTVIVHPKTYQLFISVKN